MQVKHTIFHIICYYIAWFSSVLSAANGHYWLGSSIVLLLSTVQIIELIKTKQTRCLASFIFIMIITGFGIDTLLLHANVIVFYANPWSPLTAPPWVLTLWLNFSIVLYACLRDYFRYWLPLALLSLIGFPLAYLAGAKLDAATLPQGEWALMAVGIIWMLLFPAITYSFHRKLR